MNQKIILSLFLILLISAVSALTVEVTNPNALTKINSLTTNFDITFNLTYDGNNSLTSDIYLDEDTDNSTFTETLTTAFSSANGTNTFSWNTTSVLDGTYFIYVLSTDGNETGNNYSESFLVDKTNPEAVTDLNATAGNNQIELTFTASVSADVKQYNIYRSETTGFTPDAGNLIGNTLTANYTDLTPVFGTTYYYIIKTVDNADNLSVDSSEVNSTSLDETSPVTTADGFTDNAWANTSVTVILTCDDGTGSGCNKTYYRLDDSNFTEYSASFDITADGSYALEYYSTDNAGNIETTNTATIKIDSVNPTAPQNLTATASDLTINLSWDISTDKNGSGIEYYYIFRDSILIDRTATNSYSDTGLDNNVLYNYYVIASDYADNNSTASNDANATALDTTGPTVSSNADNLWHTGTQTIELKSNDSDFKTMYYKINGTEQPNTNANPKYIDIITEGETTLEFWATDDLNNEGTHGTATIKIDNSAPNAPSLSSPGANSNGEVNLSWSKPSDNPSSANSGIKGYEIWRKLSSENYTLITTINNGDTTSYTDTGRGSGNTYYYQLKAFDNMNNYSGYGNETSVTMPSDSTNTNTGDSMPPAVSWTKPKNKDSITDINVSLKAYVSDSDSELVFISFTYKQDSESAYHSIESFNTNLMNGYHSTVWNTAELENGTYQLKVLGRDSSGNVGDKVITVTLNKEITGTDKNEETEKTEEQLLAEEQINKAKESKTQAIDLINYWKTMNIDFSGDERIIKGNELIIQAEKELKENKVFNSIDTAKEAEKNFDEFNSETTIKTIQSFTSENQEMNLNGKISKENTDLKKSINVSREMQLIEVTYNGETYFQENFVLKLKNNSEETKTFKAVEIIPKELIENTDLIKSSYSFTVIESDPVIEWEITLEAGEEKTITYSLDKQLTQEEADKITEKSILLFKGNPVLAGTKTKINNNSLNTATGFFLFDNMLPIGLGVLIIAGLIGVFFFVKKNNIELFKGKEDNEVREGLASAYSQNFNGRKTLRETEKPKQRISPIRDGESGGRFSYKGD